ncbi:unnamed protein product [Alopecurus aequalis]
MAVTYHAPRRQPHPPPPVPHRRRPTADVDVVMDGTVIRTTVTFSADDVVTFLQEVQERFRKEVHEYKNLKEGQDQEQQGWEEERHCLIVGLDTECLQNEDGKPRYQIAVLQLCIGDRCLVYQIHRAKYIVPAELEDFLANPDFCFVVVGVGEDVKRLQDDCKLKVAHTMDLPQVAAVVLGRPDLQQAGLQKLALEVMDTLIAKPKQVTMSSWAEPDLSSEQISYACIDAFVSFDVGRRLLCKPCV